MIDLAALAAVVVWYRWIGPTAAGMEALRDVLLTTGLATACVLSAVAGWRLFMRLEAIDGRDADVNWPSWLRSAITREDRDTLARARRTNPLWLLVKKELRIQQLSFVVAGINVLIWLGLAVLGRFEDASRPVLEAIVVLYGGLLAILIGALASAEERRMGTLEWQTLLPVTAWRQFVVKTAVALGLSLALAFALPVLMAQGELGVSLWHAGAVLLLTIGSLLVSSLCGSGLKAMAVSGPALFVVVVLLGWSFSVGSVGRDAGLATVGGAGVVACLRQSPDRVIEAAIRSSRNAPARDTNDASHPCPPSNTCSTTVTPAPRSAATSAAAFSAVYHASVVPRPSNVMGRRSATGTTSGGTSPARAITPSPAVGTNAAARYAIATPCEKPTYTSGLVMPASPASSPSTAAM